MSEQHSHCQCDQCSGVDCGQDDLDSYKQAQDKRDDQIRQDEREKVLDEMRLNCFGKYQMNNSRCLICQIGEKCYDKRESLRKKDGE